jgi:acylphosphatase
MERRGVEIRGIVQGVGFRPFVCSVAARHGLTGFVRNRTGVVAIEGTRTKRRRGTGLIRNGRTSAPAWKPAPFGGGTVLPHRSPGPPGRRPAPG